MHSNEKIRSKFNEVEIEQFMKLLDVKPTRDWRDESVYHWKLGMREYEDENQEKDPYFHLFGEIEREGAEKILTRNWREGTEVKFEMHEKKPVRREYRF